MLSDIVPKSFKSFFKNIYVFAILFTSLIVVTSFLFLIAAGIGWLFAIPADLGMLILSGIIFIGLWINSAYERNNQCT
jgi:hypothetical protein